MIMEVHHAVGTVSPTMFDTPYDFVAIDKLGIFDTDTRAARCEQVFSDKLILWEVFLAVVVNV